MVRKTESWIIPGIREYNCSDINGTSTKGVPADLFLKSKSFEEIFLIQTLFRFGSLSTHSALHWLDVNSAHDPHCVYGMLVRLQECVNRTAPK